MAYISYNKFWESKFDGIVVWLEEINYKLLILVN